MRTGERAHVRAADAPRAAQRETQQHIYVLRVLYIWLRLPHSYAVRVVAPALPYSCCTDAVHAADGTLTML